MKIYISFFTQVVTHTMLKLAMNTCIVSLQLSQLHIHIEETSIETVCKRIRNLPHPRQISTNTSKLKALDHLLLWPWFQKHPSLFVCKAFQAVECCS